MALDAVSLMRARGARNSILAGARHRDRIRWRRPVRSLAKAACGRGGPYVFNGAILWPRRKANDSQMKATPPHLSGRRRRWLKIEDRSTATARPSQDLAFTEDWPADRLVRWPRSSR